MTTVIVLIFNSFIVLINLIIFWQLIRFRQYVRELNQNIVSMEEEFLLLLKQVPLDIFLTALEIQQYKYNYQQLRQKAKYIQRIIIISQYIYRIWKKQIA